MAGYLIEGDNGNNYLEGYDGFHGEPIDADNWVLYTPDDDIYGFEGNDTLLGFGGDDRLFGGEGHDYARGGKDNDRVFGDAGHDTLFGDTGHDYISGGEGNDTLLGGEGNDTLLGDAGNDYISGQSGFDRATGGLGADKFSLQTNGSLDYLGAGGMEIFDFDSVEGDKILVADLGVGNDLYDVGIVNWTGDPLIDDTAIYYDGDVIAVARDNDTVTIGGDFSFVS